MIRIAIVEDQRVTLESLRALFSGTPGFHCVGAYASAEAALGQLPSGTDVVLVDILLRGRSGIELVRELKTLRPTLTCVVITAFEDNEKIFNAVVAGADGYMLKSTPPARLIQAVEEAHHDGGSMTPTIARKVLNFFRQLAEPTTALSPAALTEREQAVLRELARGLPYKSIAAALSVSLSTVKVHLKSIYQKLHVHSRTEAVVKYLGRG